MNKPTGVSDEQVFTQDESMSDIPMMLTTSSNIVDHENYLEKLTRSSSIVDHPSHLETIAGTFSKSCDSTTASIAGENPEQITVEEGADLGSQDKSSSVSIEVSLGILLFLFNECISWFTPSIYSLLFLAFFSRKHWWLSQCQLYCKTTKLHLQI